MRRCILALTVVFACSKEAKHKEELAAAQASASAAAGVESAALVKAMASAPSSSAKAEPPAGEWITAQHILIAYKGARSAPRNVTRSKDEAKKRADEAREKAKDPKLDFTDLVNLYSDATDRQGSLGKIKRGNVVKEFADAAWALKVDEVSDPVETVFGFHIIKRNQ